jgi:glutathione synthase/RimK-type ligase-like ATP-grasp enzyme
MKGADGICHGSTELQHILNSKDRRLSAKAAPANGLVFAGVDI